MMESNEHSNILIENSETYINCKEGSKSENVIINKKNAIVRNVLSKITITLNTAIISFAVLIIFFFFSLYLLLSNLSEVENTKSQLSMMESFTGYTEGIEKYYENDEYAEYYNSVIPGDSLFSGSINALKRSVFFNYLKVVLGAIVMIISLPLILYLVNYFRTRET